MCTTKYCLWRAGLLKCHKQTEIERVFRLKIEITCNFYSPSMSVFTECWWSGRRDQGSETENSSSMRGEEIKMLKVRVRNPLPLNRMSVWKKQQLIFCSDWYEKSEMNTTCQWTLDTRSLSRFAYSLHLFICCCFFLREYDQLCDQCQWGLCMLFYE